MKRILGLNWGTNSIGSKSDESYDVISRSNNTLISESDLSTKVKRKVFFYIDINDKEKSKADYVNQTDAVTRIKNTVDLIRRIYGDEKCQKGVSPKKLFFK